jgi:hypothetical protein
MTVLGASSGQNPVENLETYLARERELSVWSYPHFVRYLRAIIYKLTPQLHHCVQTVLAAADEILAEHCAPRKLSHLMTQPPNKPGRGRAARQVANAICEVVGTWAGFHDVCVIGNDEDRYRLALSDAKSAEREAVNIGLTPDDLYECAIAASAVDEVDQNRRDAAVAAMSAGHFRLAHDIITDTSREKS